MKELKSAAYKVTTPISLSKKPTLLDLGSKNRLEDNLADVRETLSELQDVMYAHGKYSVLIVLQGMDTSGKDSLIREVFKELNPRGVVVQSFKQPTTLELRHDFLWRHIIALPERGKFAIFNRSHYENVLVARVHPQIVVNENLPKITSVSDIPADFWDNRMQQIINFENHIADNGTIVLKFFLHLGKKEQADRLLRRIEKKKHNWKFSPGDLNERESWYDYQRYYEDAINKTSTQKAPWFVVPADDKASTRLIIANIILEELQKYTDIEEPELDPEIQANLEKYKQILENE